MDIRWRLRRARKQRRERRFTAELRRGGAQIDPTTFIDAGCWVKAPLTVEYGARIGRCRFTGSEAITIGRYAMVSADVKMHSDNHDYRAVNMQGALQRRLGLGYHMSSRGPIRIGHATFVGEAAIVLSGVTVGDGAFVAAGAVVTKDVAPFSIVGGNPAKLIGWRFDEAEIARLTELAWWEWTEEEMREQPELFAEPLTSHVPGHKTFDSRPTSTAGP